jgi:hypothetical protein
MGSIKQPEKVVLIAGIMAQSPEFLAGAKNLLVQRYESISQESPVYAFSHSDYYEKEMGPGLVKQLVSFTGLVAMDTLADIKIATNAIEESLAQRRGDTFFRTVNIDPGYVALSKMVLATTKNYDHRIYIGKGIYAEVTLHFRNKSYEPLEWTYPDYQQPLVIAFLNQVRENYKRMIMPEK